MTDLLLHGRRVETYFDLLGTKENAITRSVGWALAHSPRLSRGIVKATFPKLGLEEVSAVTLQEHGGDRGFTDIELRSNHAHVIVEAKRGWNLPGLEQLRRYALRLKRGSANHRAILVLAECTEEYAGGRLPATVSGIPIRYLSWRKVALLAKAGRAKAGPAEKRLLDELFEYLKGLTNMQDKESNLVYLLALAAGAPPWSSLTWIQFVTEKRRYFHPLGGNGWPAIPPTYLGFRYRGELQSIHHVDGYEFVPDFAPYFPEIDQQKWKKHKRADAYILYSLGPPIRPPRQVKTGKLYANGRYWAALDLLLTSKTISQARDRTRQRLARVK